MGIRSLNECYARADIEIRYKSENTTFNATQQIFYVSINSLPQTKTVTFKIPKHYVLTGRSGIRAYLMCPNGELKSNKLYQF
jgi:hypothetical protein